MPLVVFRVEKIKTAGNLAGALSHMYRMRPTDNADPNVSNISIKKPVGDIDEIMKQIAELNGGKLRENGVIVSDIVISASKEYFRPSDPERAGFYEPEKLQEWRDAMEPWIQQQFPHALAIELHLDESTPHYSILDLPFNPATGKLSHRAKFGGDHRTDLAAWQDKAAEPVAKLGIERGLAGSTANHVAIKKIYGHFKKPTEVFKNPTDAVVIPSIFNRTTADLNAFAIEQRAIVFNAIKPLYIAAVTKAKAVDLANNKMADMARTNTRLSADKDALKREADKLRELPIDIVLKRVYGAALEPDSKAEHASRKYELGDGRKVAVTAGNQGADVWLIQGENGKRGAINLVMQMDGLDYKNAVRVLSDHFGTSEISSEITALKQRQAAREVEEIKKIPAPVPAPSIEKWVKVKKYLHEMRALPTKLIDFLYQQRLVFADNNANAVFPREKGGAYVRGTTNKPFFRAVGGKDQGAFVIPGLGDCYLCESPIDAASIKAMRPDAHIIGMGGAMLTPNDINAPEGRKMHLAFDNDSAGKAFTAEALKKWPDAVIAKPPKKDWNDAIKSDKSLIDAKWHDVDDGSITKPTPAFKI